MATICVLCAVSIATGSIVRLLTDGIEAYGIARGISAPVAVTGLFASMARSIWHGGQSDSSQTDSAAGNVNPED